MLITGPVYTWGLKKKRRYMVVTLPYEQARQCFKAEVYSASEGRGEQRVNKKGHVKYIEREIAEDRFTPTPIHVSLREKHRKLLRTEEVNGQLFGSINLAEGQNLPISDGGSKFNNLATLPLTNGDHRNSAISNLVHANVEGANQLPITAIILIDGDPKIDFLNLQKSKTVDSAHMLALKIQTRTIGGKYADVMEIAMSIAKFFDKHADNPFAKQIRFDSKGAKPLPLSRLCKVSTGDILCSFVGLAKIASATSLDAQTLSLWLVRVMKHLETEATDLIDEDMLLTPPPDGNPNCVAVLLGVLTLFVHRLQLLEREEPSLEDLDALVHAARQTLDIPVNALTSSEAKRVFLGQFAAALFECVETTKHCGVPLELVKVLNPSCMGLPPLPREKKARGRKPQSLGVVTETPAGETVSA